MNIAHRWTFEVPASPERAWSVVSDTDRLNRSLRLGLSFEERREANGELVRTGSITRFGMTIRWSERDFDFRAPVRLTHERRYDQGPVERSRLEIRIERLPSGSRLHYHLLLEPRSILFYPVVLADFRLSTRPAFDRSLAELKKLLAGEPNRYDPPPPPLDARRQAQLDAGLAPLGPPIAQALRHHILQAPLVRQARIRPLEFAAREGLDPDEVVVAFLRAVRAGALELAWELLCPSCKAPKGGSDTLSLDLETHCSSCNIRYDASFPESVEAVFRPHRAIRVVGLDVACLLSPARTPHVIFQAPLDAEQTLEFTLELRPGGYRIDTSPWFGGASIEVRPVLRAARITADLTEEGVQPAVFRVRPGPVTIVLRNRLDLSVRLSVQRVKRPDYMLSAGRLLEIPEARALLPERSVADALDTALVSLVVVALHKVREGAQNQIALRTFSSPEEALAFLQTWDGDPTIGFGVAHGPVTMLHQGLRETPTGRTVERALNLLRSAGGGRIRVDASVDFGDALEQVADTTPGPSWYDLHLRALVDRRAAAAEQATRADDEPSTTTPATIGPYTIVSLLGRGGMGRVFHARTPDGEAVVLKTLLPHWAAHPNHVQRFYNEAFLTQRIEHPNVVRVLDYGTSGDTVYMVMEKIDGEELEARLCRGKMDVPSVLHIGEQVLRALHAAHRRGIVHRDIKPQNILLTPDGGVKVIDFGIAVEIGADDELAKRRILVGSPPYMSPEQVLFHPLDGRSDQFSLACVLFECLCGLPPFDGSTPRAMALARVYGTAKSLAERGLENPPRALEAVLERALAKEAEHRYEDALRMAEALDTSR